MKSAPASTSLVKSAQTTLRKHLVKFAQTALRKHLVKSAQTALRKHLVKFAQPTLRKYFVNSQHFLGKISPDSTSSNAPTQFFIKSVQPTLRQICPSKHFVKSVPGNTSSNLPQQALRKICPRQHFVRLGPLLCQLNAGRDVLWCRDAGQSLR